MDIDVRRLFGAVLLGWIITGIAITLAACAPDPARYWGELAKGVGEVQPGQRP